MNRRSEESTRSSVGTDIIYIYSNIYTVYIIYAGIITEDMLCLFMQTVENIGSL